MLILTEKPSVAKSFAQAFGARSNGQFFENGETVITNCRGHLFELYKPEDYDEQLKKWSTETLPIIPQKYLYKRIESASKQTSIVLRLLKEHRNDKIVIATDADREGEVIARIVINEAGLRDYSKCYRFWISAALTKDSILKAMTQLKSWSEYDNLSARGFARQRADWLVGMNITRYITLSCGGRQVFPVGRVQTAILAAVAQRNNEVKNFVSTPYYECIASLQDASQNKIETTLVNPENNKTFFLKLSDYINNANGYSKENKSITIDTQSTQKQKSAPHLFNLTNLSIVAARLYDMSASKVESIAEILYDKYKCLSYPRTPSTVMGESEEDVKTFIDKFNLIKDDWEISKYCNPTLINIKNKNLFNDKKLEGHYALIPFGKLPESATQDEKRIYDLVARQFLMACMEPCIYNEKLLTIHNGQYLYRAKVNTVISAGWTLAKSNNDDEDEPLVTFNEKQCKLLGTEIKKKMTTPKKEYTEASLLSFMKNPTSENENDGKLVGLGTEATRGAILQKLQDSGYMIKEKKKFYATDKGYFLLNQLFKNEYTKKIALINQTTLWEKQLETSPQNFEKSMIEYIKQCVSIKIETKTFEKAGIAKCPLCGKNVFEGKQSYFCEGYKANPKCNFTIWKAVCGANITLADAKLLIEGKSTAPKKMKSKAGKAFSAKLKYDKNENKIKFDFENKNTNYKKFSKKGGTNDK